MSLIRRLNAAEERFRADHPFIYGAAEASVLVLAGMFFSALLMLDGTCAP